MELRYLRYFVAVAQELHFGRAAQRVGIVQPALSQQIKTLEQEIGAELFRRSKRRVELTAAGQAFLAEAQKTLAQAEHALLVARRAAQGKIGSLRIGFVSSAVFGDSVKAFQRMRLQHPDVALSLQDMTSEEQVTALKAKQLDLGLVRPPVRAAENLSLRIVGLEPFIVALPQRHRLARQKEIPLGALAGEPFLLVPRQLGPGFYDKIIQACAEAGFVPHVFQEARTTQTIVNLIAGGMGVSLVPASFQNVRRAGVVYRPLRRPAPTTELAALWRADDSSPVVASFLHILWQVMEVNEAGAPR